MSGYTKGPWKVGNRFTTSGVYTESGEIIANTHGAQRNFNRTEQIVEQDANARLIAAAPDLLEALEEIIASECQQPALGCAWTKARAAIARTKGETHE